MTVFYSLPFWWTTPRAFAHHNQCKPHSNLYYFFYFFYFFLFFSCVFQD